MKQQVRAISEIDDAIRMGRFDEARQYLERLLETKPESRHFAQIAQLCARVGRPDVGVRLLRRHITRRGSEATPREIGEYSLCLIRVGVVDEARRRLVRLDPSEVPETHFYLALTEIARWNHSAAVQYLKRYLDHASVTPYQKNVAEINLVASLIFEGYYEEADTRLPVLRETFERANNKLLFANACELTTASLIYQGDYEAANESLSVAEKILQAHSTVDSLFVGKWKAVLGYIGGDDKALDAFRKVAIERKHWESVRETDRFEAVLGNDREVFTKVYCGTPFPAYRRKLLNDFPVKFELPAYFDWKLGGEDTVDVHDLLWGTIGNEKCIPMGRSAHDLLTVLSTDFYRSFRVPNLFERLFPNESFHEETSSKRVHAAIQDLREWLNEHCPGLEVSETEQFYRLTSPETFVLRTRIIDWTENELSVPLAFLRTEKGGEPFTPKWASERTLIPIRTLNRIISDGVDRGKIEKIGAGRSTRYRFAA